MIDPRVTVKNTIHCVIFCAAVFLMPKSVMVWLTLDAYNDAITNPYTQVMAALEQHIKQLFLSNAIFLLR